MRLIWIILGVLLCMPTVVPAVEKPAYELGIRGGISSDRIDRVHEDYSVWEVYLLKDFPWRHDFGEYVQMRSRFDAGVFSLEANSDHGELIAAGADLLLVLFEQIELEIGFRPTWMTDHQYSEDDFGGPAQFSSHVGASVVWRNLALGYRLQHISNAGIYSRNPGLNLHLFGIGYRF